MPKKKAPAKLLLFWDYDTQWGADRSRSPGLKTWGWLEFENTEQLLELHGSYDLPACFAVVGAAAKPGSRPYHDPDQIRRIHHAGHEIASHSYTHDWIPGLSRKELMATLTDSKAALEDCVGAEVISFVPPYNQPFDFMARGSISLSERKTAGPKHIGLRALCEGLAETGYRFCRVAYRPWQTRLREALRRKRLDEPSAIENIAGVQCIRLNTPGGFQRAALEMLESCDDGRYVVVYGHPHSLHTGNSQDLKYLVPFFERVKELRKSGRIELTQPRDLFAGARRLSPA